MQISRVLMRGGVFTEHVNRDFSALAGASTSASCADVCDAFFSEFRTGLRGICSECAETDLSLETEPTKQVSFVTATRPHLSS